MTQNVEITVTGIQYDIEDSSITTVSKGEYFFKNGKHYILYQEMDDMQNVIKNTLKISADKIEILKKGSAKTHMIFEVGKKHTVAYQTPVGELLVGTDTKEMQIKEQEHEILAEILYALEMNEEPLSNCKIDISIKEQL